MKTVKLVLLIAFVTIVFVGCKDEKKYEVKHTFYVRNQLGGDEQKIADFYQGLTGKADCELLKKVWEKNGYTAYCVSHEVLQ